MTLALRGRVGLVAGLLAGLTLGRTHSAAAPALLSITTPAGIVFINLMAAILLTIAATMSLAIAQPVLATLPIGASSGLSVARPTSDPTVVGAPAETRISRIAQWFVDLVPEHVIKAAADGAMLPVIVFAVLFGIALGQVPDSRRASVLRAVEGVAVVDRCPPARSFRSAPLPRRSRSRRDRRWQRCRQCDREHGAWRSAGGSQQCR